MDDLISKLSEIRTQYNCFDDDEAPFYRALSEAIRILSKRADGDTISRAEAIDALWKALYEYEDKTEKQFQESDELDVGDWILHRVFVQNMSDIDRQTILELPSAQPEPQWIPIKWHDCTDEDREKYGFSNDIVAVFDCEMPDDDQPILVTTSHGYVNQDVCYIDDGYSLDSGWDWIDDIKAWMPLPEPYKEGEQNETD